MDYLFGSKPVFGSSVAVSTCIVWLELACSELEVSPAVSPVVSSSAL